MIRQTLAFWVHLCTSLHPYSSSLEGIPLATSHGCSQHLLNEKIEHNIQNSLYIYMKKVPRSGVDLRSSRGWITSNQANVRMYKYFDAIPINNAERNSVIQLRAFIYTGDIQHIDVFKQMDIGTNIECCTCITLVNIKVLHPWCRDILRFLGESYPYLGPPLQLTILSMGSVHFTTPNHNWVQYP